MTLGGCRRITALLLVVGCCAVPSHAADTNGNGIDDRFELPGTQPNFALPMPGTTFQVNASIPDAGVCAGCHNLPAELRGPFWPWSGSMMGNAARDPVFWAQLDVAEGDEAANPSILAGARDLCLRCHMPRGWLEGRSSAPVAGGALATALRGMAMQEPDLNGVQCEVCHRMIDRDTAKLDAVDLPIVNGLLLNPDPTLQIPSSYGNAMYVMDRVDVRRGPYTKDKIGWPFLQMSQFVPDSLPWPPPTGNLHPAKHSPFHRTGFLCGTCHDVSVPAWGPSPLPPKDDVQLNFPIERTFTEWRFSDYANRGEDGNCQSCHMNGALNATVSGGVSSLANGVSVHLNDVHVHDLTGGNSCIPLVIKEMATRFQATKTVADPGSGATVGTTQAARDTFLQTNYAAVLRHLYPAGTYASTAALEPLPATFDETSYTATSARALATLARAANLSATRPAAADLAVRVWNNTGHKLPTGYPEGRRMWLNIRFQDVDATTGASTLRAQSGEYDATTGELYNDSNLDNATGAPNPKTGHRTDVGHYTDGAGNELTIGRRTQVYEARAHNSASGKEFHFILNNEALHDNRIPPAGWNAASYQANRAAQVVNPPYSSSQHVYQDATTGPPADAPFNFDEIAYAVPANSDVADVRLQYQSVSREYVEELVAANARTLVYPTVNGFSRGDILEHAWRTFSIDGQTRFPPVEMTKLRVALVDSDGDGLPDDWETAFGLDPNDASGDNGRNGDPDADGRSNYLEFQEGTAPNVAQGSRAPLDLVLVLDVSGSMNDVAPGGTNLKIDALKDAVDLFLRTWKTYAIRQDKLGVVYFSTNVTTEAGGLIDFSTLPAGTTISSRVDDLIAAVRARTANGFTALGAGLETALGLELASGPGRRKHVIVFTNGMQNFSPMVRDDLFGSGNYYVHPEPVSGVAGVFGDSGVTDAGGPAFDTRLDTLGVIVHAIGIGVAETADDRWYNLVAGIATDTAGKSQFIARGSDLEGAFLHDLVASLRGFSPQFVAEHRKTLAQGEAAQDVTFQVEEAATKASFILSWSGAAVPGPLTFDLIAPQGESVAPLALVTQAPSYVIATVYFPLARSDGRPVAHAGTWTMRIQRGPARNGELTHDGRAWRQAVDYRAYLIADVPTMDFLFRFTRDQYRAGEAIRLEAALLEGSRPLRSVDRVLATVKRPRLGFGSFLARATVPVDLVQADLTSAVDPPVDAAGAKAIRALKDPGLAATVAPVADRIELFDDGDAAHGDLAAGDGIFSAALGDAGPTGLLSAEADVEGQNGQSRLDRRLTASATVVPASFAGTSRADARWLQAPPGGPTFEARITPIDAYGNYRGPGYARRVVIEVPGYTAASDVTDNLDGSYSRQFAVPPGAVNVSVDASVNGEPVFHGSASSLTGGAGAGGIPLWIVLLLVMVILLLLILLIWR